jgi:N-acetylneuraminic acid mutarotase
MKASKVVFLIFLITLPFCEVNTRLVRAIENSWTTKASMQTARAQLGVAAVNGKIYAIGGGNNSVTGGPNVLNVNEEYDAATNTWTTREPIPTARHSFGIAVYQNKIYCIGGSTNGPHLAVNEVYDPATNSWETKTSMPTARAGLTANTVNGKIYLMGGEPANTTNEAYDPTTDSWSTKAQIPKSAVYSQSAVLENKVYLIGGLSSRSSNQIYDPETDTWTSGTPVPAGVAEGAAIATIGVNAPVRVYVIGGETTYVRNGVAHGNVTDLNQVYDPKSNTWSTGAPLPTELRFFGLAAVNDTLYAIGGFPELIEFLDTNYQYTPIDYGKVGQQPTPFFSSPVGIAVIVIAIIALAAVITYIFYKRKK